MLLGGGVIALVWWKEREHLAQRRDTAATVVQVSVPSGARPRTFPLADGSRVTLAPGSSLVSRGAFGDTERTLTLTGEAWFDVAGGSAPFVVLAAGVRVQDVSTAFVVRAMSASEGQLPRALVSVTQGDVRVQTTQWEGAVHEGHAMLVDSTGTHAQLDHDEALGSVAWTSGALLFSDESVASVVERLVRWTGLHIDVDPSLRAHLLSLAIENESPEASVKRVAEAVGARAVASGEHWAIVPP
jgi:transmembrane sensor